MSCEKTRLIQRKEEIPLKKNRKPISQQKTAMSTVIEPKVTCDEEDSQLT